MPPPRLIRRLVLAPLAVVVAIAVAVLFPLLAVLTWIVGLLRRPGTSRNRPLRLLFFALVWLFADAAAVFMCLSLWIASGFGGGLRPEAYQTPPHPVRRGVLRPGHRAAARPLCPRREHDPTEA